MTLFFSGLILAILLPFQYVSLRRSQWVTWGGRGPTGPRVLFPPTPSREGPEPKAYSLPSCPAPPGTCPGLIGSVSKPTRRPFLAGLGTCLLHEPHPASPFPSSLLSGGGEAAGRGAMGHLNPWQGREPGAPRDHQAQRGPEEGPPGSPGASAKSREADWPARQLGVEEVGPEPIPTPLSIHEASQISAL